MKKGTQDVVRGYLGNIRSSRWYLGSTMILDQVVTFDRDYALISVSLIGNLYGYTDGFGGSITPDDLQGSTILGLYVNSSGSVVTLQVDTEITGLNEITMYAVASNGTDGTVDLVRTGTTTYEAVSPELVTTFVAAYLGDGGVSVNLTGTIT